MVGDAAKKAKPGEWIIGRGWHQEKWSRGAVAERRRLSAARRAQPRVAEQPGLADARQRPRRLRQRAGDEDGRSARRRRPIPHGGKILRDKDGNATGLFNERAQSLVGDALARDRATRTPAQVEADLRTVIELASREALSKGLTTVHDAGSPPSTIEVMKRVVDEGKLPLRVWMMLREDAGPARRRHAEVPRSSTTATSGSPCARIKRAIDGALGSRGAWMLEPYADLPSTSGMNTDSLDDIRHDRGAGDQERLPDGGPRHRRPRQPRDAEHLRGGVQAASREEQQGRCAGGSSTRSTSAPPTSRASAGSA